MPWMQSQHHKLSDDGRRTHLVHARGKAYGRLVSHFVQADKCPSLLLKAGKQRTVLYQWRVSEVGVRIHGLDAQSSSTP
jgi:hypothetical protein